MKTNTLDISTGFNFQEYLGTLATFGHIGNVANDNNNTFANAALFGNGWGIYRYSMAQHTFKIYTNNFSQTFSDALGGIPSKYLVNPASNPYNCPANLAKPAPDSVNIPGFTNEEALAIVIDSMEYAGFNEVAQWMQEQELLSQLDKDPILRMSDAKLQSFYANAMQEKNGLLLHIEQLFAELSDSTLASDSLMYAQRIALIDSLNSSFSCTIPMEQNWQSINRFRLKWICGGIDSLSMDEKDTLASLAAMCPFIGGTAVYKARSIYTEINPIYLDDAEVCNQAGVYRMSQPNEDNEYIDPLLLEALGNQHLKLYPNPASTQLTIDYTLELGEEGKLMIYDLLGREFMSSNLSATISRVVLDISSLPKGMYLCKYTVNGKITETHKLIKE